MSLVTTPSSRLVACSACGSTKVTAIAMTLTDGSVVDFASCHNCERKFWSREGEPLPLDWVLDRARKRT